MAPISSTRALIYIHSAALLFGLTGIFGAVIVASALMITFGRAALAVLTLALFSVSRKQQICPRLSWPLVINLGRAGAFLALHWVTFFMAVKLGGVAIATLGFASFPAFITLVEHFVFHERVSWREALALVFVSMGLVLITPAFSFEDSGTLALLWGLFSGLMFALLALSNRYATTKLPPMQVATIQNGFVALYTLPFIVFEFAQVSLISWLWLALLGGFCTGLSHFLFVSSLTQLKARTAGLIIALEPLYAIMFAWVLFHDMPSIKMLIGGALILFAVVYSTLVGKK